MTCFGQIITASVDTVAEFAITTKGNIMGSKSDAEMCDLNVSDVENILTRKENV